MHQIWYADDACGAGKINSLRVWWDQINILGPRFGYFPNATKTWLVTKENSFSAAEAVFADTIVRSR